jgi:voltage-gated potassium channel Kch
MPATKGHSIGIALLKTAALFGAMGMQNYLIFWILGFATFWAGLKLFDDEVLLIAALIVGAGLVLIGLFSAPAGLQIAIEIALIVSLFHLCMECISRGDRP